MAFLIADEDGKAGEGHIVIVKGKDVSNGTTNGETNGVKEEPKKFGPPGMKCEPRNLYEGKPDNRGRTSWTTTYPTDIDEPAENAESAQYALIVRNRKCYDGRRKLEIDSLVVQSPLLKKFLGEVLKGYPGITTSLARLEFKAPFQPFVHRWERFVKLREDITDDELKAHVDLLWNTLNEELGDVIREKNDHIALGVSTFEAVWTIFEPGCIVYTDDDGHRAYKLTRGSYGENRCSRFYALNCQYVDFDGENFGYGSETVAIGAFSGTRAITKMDAFPLKYHPDHENVATGLIAQGKLFESYKGHHFKHYDGVATGFGPFGPIRYSVNSRIIIDTYAYSRFNPNRKVHLDFMKPSSKSSKRKIYDEDELDEDDDYTDYSEDEDSDYYDDNIKPKNTCGPDALTAQQHLICTSSLRGYSLKDKKWLLFHLSSVKEITWNEHAFSSLVAPPEQKDLILAFAESQNSNKGSFDDVIQGKGRGIIMLLSGPPGVGKTLTAESVAETMKVPLYMMSAGDLGTQPNQVESALANILEMNTKWNAVLLLDEADVFLEARSAHDLERNKLVSIFLRLLEYYEGILFLTTNRVDNIDAAFESRIHLSLTYEELDEASRRHVWTAFLDRSVNVDRKAFTEEDIAGLAKEKLNGRQIKNILKTSGLLAARQNKDLGPGHVETVLRLRRQNERRNQKSLEA